LLWNAECSWKCPLSVEAKSPHQQHTPKTAQQNLIQPNARQYREAI
jgi:hypothetical protein